jgi:hypothetical protein
MAAFSGVAVSCVIEIPYPSVRSFLVRSQALRGRVFSRPPGFYNSKSFLHILIKPQFTIENVPNHPGKE